MADPERVTLSGEMRDALIQATRLYTRALRLPDHAPILFIEDTYDPMDIHVLARRTFAHLLAGPLQRQSRYIRFLEFHPDADPAYMTGEVRTQLNELNGKNLDNVPMTVVFLGRQRETNESMFDLLRQFSRDSQEIWLADSTGATLEQLMDMSRSVPVVVEHM